MDRIDRNGRIVENKFKNNLNSTLDYVTSYGLEE
jgi:hypothetical protein